MDFLAQKGGVSMSKTRRAQIQVLTSQVRPGMPLIWAILRIYGSRDLGMMSKTRRAQVPVLISQVRPGLGNSADLEI